MSQESYHEGVNIQHEWTPSLANCADTTRSDSSSHYRWAFFLSFFHWKHRRRRYGDSRARLLFVAPGLYSRCRTVSNRHEPAHHRPGARAGRWNTSEVCVVSTYPLCYLPNPEAHPGWETRLPFFLPLFPHAKTTRGARNRETPEMRPHLSSWGKLAAAMHFERWRKNAVKPHSDGTIIAATCGKSRGKARIPRSWRVGRSRRKDVRFGRCVLLTFVVCSESRCAGRLK